MFGFGSIEDLKELFDLIEALDGGDDITVEIATNKEAVEKTEKKPEEKTEEQKMEEEEERLRVEAKKARDEVAKMYGEDKANDVLELSARCAMISSLLEDNIQLDQKMVDEYNHYCSKLHPEKNSRFIRELTYAQLRKLSREGIEALG